jgi:hypothetical protein
MSGCGGGGGSWTRAVTWVGVVSRSASRWRGVAVFVACASNRALINAICSRMSESASGGGVESRVL